MKKCAATALSALLLNSAPVGQAQDVAAPDMPNLDLEGEEARKLAAWKKSMIQFMVLMNIGQVLNHDKGFSTVKEAVAWQVGAMPLKMLKSCPAEFRTVIQEWIDACQNNEVTEKQHVLLHQRLKAVMEKYKVNESVKDLTDWALGKYMSEFERCAAIGPALIERLKKIRQGVEEGTMELPAL